MRRIGSVFIALALAVGCNKKSTTQEQPWNADEHQESSAALNLSVGAESAPEVEATAVASVTVAATETSIAVSPPGAAGTSVPAFPTESSPTAVPEVTSTVAATIPPTVVAPVKETATAKPIISTPRPDVKLTVDACKVAVDPVIRGACCRTRYSELEYCKAFFDVCKKKGLPGMIAWSLKDGSKVCCPPNQFPTGYPQSENTRQVCMTQEALASSDGMKNPDGTPKLNKDNWSIASASVLTLLVIKKHFDILQCYEAATSFCTNDRTNREAFQPINPGGFANVKACLESLYAMCLERTSLLN